MWSAGKEPGERRGTPRESGPLAGVVKLYNGRSLPCVVLNLSETGAKLSISRDVILPTEFQLSIPARQVSWRVRVAWQDQGQLGVYRM
jgi:hypothetical protein